jgi:hypothetical protein
LTVDDYVGATRRLVLVRAARADREGRTSLVPADEFPTHLFDRINRKSLNFVNRQPSTVNLQ